MRSSETETVNECTDYALENNIPVLESKQPKKEIFEYPMFYIMMYMIFQLFIYTFYITIGNIYINSAGLFGQNIILCFLCCTICDIKCNRENIKMAFLVYSLLIIQTCNIVLFTYLIFVKSNHEFQDN